MHFTSWHWLAQRGQTAAETLSREKIKHWIEAGVGCSQAQSHHDRLLHGNPLCTGSVSPGQEVQVDGSLYVVGHEADEKGQQDDDNHPDGSGVCAPLTTSSMGARQ